MTDRIHRSVVKSISWRVTGTLDTILISYLVTGRARLALSIGFVELFTKCFLYFLHERVWERLRYGRNVAPADETLPSNGHASLDPARGGLAA